MNTNWQRLSSPRVCGLIADSPTGLSLAMHTAGFRKLGLDFTYRTFDTRDTEAALLKMTNQGYRGYSVSIPHKENALTYLDWLSEEASAIGAVNTVLNTGEKLLGFNTDGHGIVETFREAALELNEKNVLILGAGGAAKAAVFALKSLGAASITIANRTPARASALAASRNLTAVSWQSLNDAALSSYQVLLNTTPIGSKLADDNERYPFSYSAISSSQCVFDCVTNDTPLTRAAKQSGALTLYGSRMLLFQALGQFELFTEKEAPQAAMQEALLQELAK